MRQFARKSDMEFEKVQINEVLKRAFEIFSQQLKLRGIEVVWEIDNRLPKINADPSRLEQVFINLLLNARDAIEERWGSKETNQEDKKIILKTRHESNSIICEVCDTGKGVPQSMANKIFEPFFTTKEVGKGTGLGLSISYGIVKECAGMIQVAPHEPEGSCFILTFPVPKKKHGKNNTPR
jgi:histidine kinase